MTATRAVLEGIPIRLASNLTLVPVIGWTRWPSGWETADPLAVIVVTANGPRAMDILGRADFGPHEGDCSDSLRESWRSVLTRATLKHTPSGGCTIQVWHAAWTGNGAEDHPVSTLCLGTVVVSESSAVFEPEAVLTPTTCPCPRHGASSAAYGDAPSVSNG